MAKLTLSVDAAVVEVAKRYAAAQGTSVSHLVEDYLGALARPVAMASAPPVLRMLRGAAKGGSIDDYRTYLDTKHRL